MARKILVLLSHPTFARSTVNLRLREAVESLPNVTFRHLDAIYPKFAIDVEAEQASVRECDLLVFQHPFYWYSAPPLLKQWIDLVLVRGFAFGMREPETKGKALLSVVSAGGPESAYGPDGFNAYPIRDFLNVFERTAVFCQMTYLEPLILHDTYRIDGEAIDAHAREYARRLESF